MSDPLVSVIIPVYSVEGYLRECVDSVLSQSYSNLEIILVNDGSPDNCGVICDEYAEIDERVKVIHKSNGGLSDARNAGIDICRGTYLVFVDSDDVVHTQYIEILLRNIGDNGFIFCRYRLFENEMLFIDEPAIAYDVVLFSQTQILTQLMTFEYPLSVVAWNKLYRREIWCDLRFPYGKIHEDEFVIHQIVEKCTQIGFVDFPLYYYRQRSSSIMSLANQNKAMLDKLEAFGLRRQYFIDRKMHREVNEINGEILYRCLMQAVTADNLTWKKIDLWAILFKNKLSIEIKLILTLKKIAYPLYRKIHKYRKA